MWTMELTAHLNVWLTYVVPLVLSIKITEIQIPRYFVRDSEVTLRCRYDPEGKEIYAVKWYKDRQEFYHFLPQSPQPRGAYNISGLRVMVDKSSDSEVVLGNIDYPAAGTYKCEVSGEGPDFWTVFRTENVSVVDLPKRQPHISGHRNVYRPGENISVNCSSHGGKPAANINWFINDEQVSKDNIQHWLTQTGSGRTTSTGNLRMTVRRHHFRNGLVQLKCTASLGDVYWRSVHVDLPMFEESSRGVRSDGFRTSGGCWLRVVPLCQWILLLLTCAMVLVT